jgi:aspartate/methionine/tyrosine aminotransferase
MLMTMQLLNINPIPLPLSPAESFTPSPDLAKSLITSNTRAIALVSPNNPCGSVYSPSLLKQFYDIAKEAGIALIVDETYRDFVLSENGEPRGKPHSLFEEPGWSETLISVFSFSKSYKVPGYRLGGIVASENVLEACTTVADCIQVCFLVTCEHLADPIGVLTARTV